MFLNRLDSLFRVKEEVKGENASPDISGLIGQYAHGNEPSHHIAYLFTMAGAAEKTESMVRRIMSEMYTDARTEYAVTRIVDRCQPGMSSRQLDFILSIPLTDGSSLAVLLLTMLPYPFPEERYSLWLQRVILDERQMCRAVF
jgi:hypothetical protein